MWRQPVELHWPSSIQRNGYVLETIGRTTSVLPFLAAVCWIRSRLGTTMFVHVIRHKAGEQAFGLLGGHNTKSFEAGRLCFCLPRSLHLWAHGREAALLLMNIVRDMLSSDSIHGICISIQGASVCLKNHADTARFIECTERTKQMIVIQSVFGCDCTGWRGVRRMRREDHSVSLPYC